MLQVKSLDPHPPPKGPTPRVYSQLVNAGDRKFIIGGASMPENLLSNEVWSFSLENVEWDQNLGDLPGIQWEKFSFQVTMIARSPPHLVHRGPLARSLTCAACSRIIRFSRRLKDTARSRSRTRRCSSSEDSTRNGSAQTCRSLWTQTRNA